MIVNRIRKIGIDNQRILLKNVKRSLATSSSTTTNNPGKMFKNQNILPRLPIPSLESSTEKYLKSVEPLLTQEEMDITTTLIQEFIAKDGKMLHERLIEHDRVAKHSWLESIWLDKAYLEYREPLMINSNWWCMLEDSKELSDRFIAKPPPKGVITSTQVSRAARLINYFVDAKLMLDRGEFPAEYMKDTPICMNQYKNLFGAHRVPAPEKDILHTPFPAQSRHIMVMLKNQVYKINVIHEDGTRASQKELERLLYAAGQNSLETSSEANVGIMTAGHRDEWAEMYSDMNRIPENKENFNIIKDALFVICLDDFAMQKKAQWAHWQFFKQPENRWFDKAIQLIISSTGRVGINGEHTPCDAVVPGSMFDMIVHWEKTEKPIDNIGSDPMEPPTKLKWKGMDQHEEKINETKIKTIQAGDNVMSFIYEYKSYGDRYIKEVAQTSPDSYIQMALLTAYYRMHGKPTTIYETASTRQFLHGRTETGRSLTPESYEFIKSFDSDDITYDVKTKFFYKAAESHRRFMREAASGSGFDRHLLGLRAMRRDLTEGEAFFNDPAFMKSVSFRISTSNMSSGKRIKGGFGPVHPDGYGICYQIGKDSIRFMIAHKKDSEEAKLGPFVGELERTLKDMNLLFPRRSDVWGLRWYKRQKHEKREEMYLQKMKEWSDKQLGRNW